MSEETIVWDEIPDYADIMTLKEFVSHVKAGNFIDYDGSGYYATETQMSSKEARPSEIARGEIDDSFTHVAWFNK